MATTCLQDWVRLPGDERDVHARVAMLELRAVAHDAPPRVDDHGRLHYRGRLLALSSDEARLAALLVEHFGHVVNDRELGAVVATEPRAASSPPLRAQMTQLRARLRDVGLTLHRIRRRGYQLQHR